MIKVYNIKPAPHTPVLEYLCDIIKSYSWPPEIVWGMETSGHFVGVSFKEIFQVIGKQSDFEIDTQDVAETPEQVLLSVPSHWSLARMVERLKTTSDWSILEKFPEVKKQFRGGEAVQGQLFFPPGGEPK
jgi:hypothetical protein